MSRVNLKLGHYTQDSQLRIDLGRLQTSVNRLTSGLSKVLVARANQPPDIATETTTPRQGEALQLTSDVIIILNAEGLNRDVQVKGLLDQNLIRTDAENNLVGVGTDTPTRKLDVNGTGRYRDILDIDATSGIDLYSRAAPATPPTGVRRLFMDSATGETSVQTDAGATINLESGDAETLDGLDSLQFLRSDADDEYEAGNTLTIADTAVVNFEMAIGTSPFTVTSTTVVTNLNADTVDAIQGAEILQRDGSVALTGDWDAGAFTITISDVIPMIWSGLSPQVTFGSGTFAEQVHFLAAPGTIIATIRLTEGSSTESFTITQSTIGASFQSTTGMNFTATGGDFLIFGPAGGGSEIVINEGARNNNTRIESQNIADAFEVDASEDRVMVENRDILRYALLTT